MSKEMEAIRRWSRAMSYICALAAILFVIAPLYRAIIIDDVQLAAWLDVPQVNMTGLRRLAPYILFVLPGSLTAYGLVRLRAPFLSFAAGHIFSDAATLGLQRFAEASAMAVVIAAVATPLVGCWLTIDTLAGPDLPVNLGTGSLTLLLLSGFTWTFAKILRMATRMERRNAELAHENEAFV